MHGRELKNLWLAERGFSAIEMMITLALIGIISAFALFNVARARENMRLVSAASELQTRIEQARADAVRRHGAATVGVLDATRYQLGMDANGDGTIDVAEQRSFTLPPGVNFNVIPLPPTAVFDWRGRVPADIRFTLRGVDGQGQPTGNMPDVPVDITAGGDITVNSKAPTELTPLAATPFPTPAPTLSPTATPSPTP